MKLEITVCSNGYLILVDPGLRNDNPKQVFVFQDMGVASVERDHQKTEDTLLGFLEKYFKEYRKALDQQKP